MRILSLTVENIKRVSAVHIDTQVSPVIVLAGQNEQGKSSVIDSIQMALGGEKTIPPKPVHGDAAKGKIVADLGEFVVTRRFTAGGGTSLTVQTRDGAKYPSPQALLDGFVGRLSFDPFAFSIEKDQQKQAQTLRILCQINTTDLDIQRKAAFDERALVNRDVKTLQAQLAGMAMHPGVASGASSAVVLAQLAAADEIAKKASYAESRAADARVQLRQKTERVSALEERIVDLTAQLQRAELDLEQAQTDESLASDHLEAATRAAEGMAALVPDRAALRAEVATAQILQAQVADNARYAETTQRMESAVTQADTLTATIERCDAAKVELLAKAQFPVQGLGLSDTGVTWNGLPFEQASTAVKTKVSVAIGAALNPRLKVLLVRNGNDLDDQSMAQLEALAVEYGCQVWLERIAGAAGGHTVFIEDGTVVGAAPPTPKKDRV